jgi:hypothetical protein
MCSQLALQELQANNSPKKTKTSNPIVEQQNRSDDTNNNIGVNLKRSTAEMKPGQQPAQKRNHRT